jgi:PAS domain S-box-containing protein
MLTLPTEEHPDISSPQDEEAENLRFLVDNSSEFISICNADGRMTYLNNAGRKMVGLAPDAVDLGMNSDYVHTTESEGELKMRLTQLQLENRWEGTSYLKHFITGEAIPVYVTTLTLNNSDGAFCGRATIVRDMRPEMEARKAISEREERLRSAVELARLGTWSIDLEIGKVSYSERVRDIYGLPEGPVSEMLGVHPEDIPKVAADMEQAMHPDSGGAYNNIHRALNIRTGEIRYVHSQGQVLYDDAGVPYMMTGTLRDITEYKMAEQA